MNYQLVTIPPHTDPAARAELARWVVGMRMAQAIGIPQGRGHLKDAPGPRADAAYCCLGLRCEILVGRGLLEQQEANGRYSFGVGERGGLGSWESNFLPLAAHLDGLSPATGWGDRNPMALDATPATFRPIVGDVHGAPMSFGAAAANDSLELTFVQIADCVIWTYAVTPDELAAAAAVQADEIAAGTHRF